MSLDRVGFYLYMPYPLVGTGVTDQLQATFY